MSLNRHHLFFLHDHFHFEFLMLVAQATQLIFLAEALERVRIFFLLRLVILNDSYSGAGLNATDIFRWLLE